MRHLAVILTVMLATLSVSAQDISRQKERKKQIEEEIDLIDKQLATNRDKRQESLNTLILTRRKLNARKELISQLDDDIRGYDMSIESTDRLIHRLNARLDTLMEYHAGLIRGAYKTRDTQVWLIYILSSKDISQGLRRWSYLKNISASVREQALQIEDTRAQLQTENQRLSELKARSVNTRQEREKEREILSEEERKMNNMVIQLSKEEKTMKKQLEQMQ